MRLIAGLLACSILSAAEPPGLPPAGFILHLGCGDGALLAEVVAGGVERRIHAFDADAAAVQAANGKLRSAGVLGRARAETWQGAPPASDGIADAIVVEGGDWPRADLERICAPGGVIVSKAGGSWQAWTKPLDAGYDGWSHFRHGADRVPQSRDTFIGLPQALRWYAGPWYDQNPMVADDRVVFSLGIGNKNEERDTAKHTVWARSAFSGALLWQRDVAFDLGAKRRGRPVNGWGGGEVTAQVVNGIFATADGVLYAATKDAIVGWKTWSGAEALRVPLDAPCHQLAVAGDRIVAATEKDLRAFTRDGKPVWTIPGRAADVTLIGDAVCWMDQSAVPVSVRAAHLADGTPRWQIDTKVWFDKPYTLTPSDKGSSRAILPVRIAFGRGDTLYVVITTGLDGGVGVGDPGYGGALVALALVSGKERWRFDAPVNKKQKLPQIQSINGITWGDDEIWLTSQSGKFAIDPKTGVKKRDGFASFRMNDHCMYVFSTPKFVSWKATWWTNLADGQQFPPKRAKDAPDPEPWSTGGSGPCGSMGGLPAYGAIIQGSKGCACSLWGAGYRAGIPVASLSDRSFIDGKPGEPVRGAGQPTVTAAGGWPTFRGDAQRSGRSATPVASSSERWSVPVAHAQLTTPWHLSAGFGDRLAPPVVAGDLVVTADIEAGTVVGIDAGSGAIRWRCDLPGRIDGAATISDGRVLVGAGDGHLAALSPADGRVIWRTRVARSDRRLLAYDQLESAQPIVGGTLVAGGKVIVASGRHGSFAEGSWVTACDAASGAVAWSKRVGSRASTLALSDDGATVVRPADWMATEKQKAVSTWALADGGNVATAPASIGHLSTRIIARYARTPVGGAARNIASDGTTAVFFDGVGTEIRAMAHADATMMPLKPVQQATRWTQKLAPGQRADAIAIAGDQVWVAGAIAARDGKESTGWLRSFALGDGKPGASVALPVPPAFQGIAIADGRLYLALDDGTLRCFGR